MCQGMACTLCVRRCEHGQALLFRSACRTICRPVHLATGCGLSHHSLRGSARSYSRSAALRHAAGRLATASVTKRGWGVGITEPLPQRQALTKTRATYDVPHDDGDESVGVDMRSTPAVARPAVPSSNREAQCDFVVEFIEQTRARARFLYDGGQLHVVLLRKLQRLVAPPR